MAKFVGAFDNKIDAKGRVSVPADFRAAVAGASFDGVVAFPAFTGDAIEAGGLDRLQEIQAMIDGLDPYGDEREAFELAVMSQARKLAFDADGRITLPGELIDCAGLNGRAAFVGRGPYFQIWRPEAYAEKMAEAQARARELRGLLHTPNRQTSGAGAP
ncbi:MAG: division/cell wall cluster transcriptional repressor MraZ [Pseudomonadota bacterium]